MMSTALRPIRGAAPLETSNEMAQPAMAAFPGLGAAVDVVVVSFNSIEQLRPCVEPLCGDRRVSVIVVDNASPDHSLSAVEELDLQALALDRNGGFAHGCNVGWRAGDAPLVLFLNPDARIDRPALFRLALTLEAQPEVAAVAPRIVEADGSLAWSQRRFPRLRSTFAQALFLHRLFPNASWADEVVRDEGAYEIPGEPDWVSGACLLVRRSALEAVGGFDERFFMYREDVDLCRRLRAAGLGIRFDPGVVVAHEGGASAPRTRLIPVLAASRIRYAQKHYGRLGGAVERLGVALHALTHVVAVRGGYPARAGHAKAFAVALFPYGRRRELRVP